MDFLRRITIKKRLLIVFAILMSAFIGFSIFASMQAQKLGDVAEKIYNQPMQVSSAATEAHYNVIKIHRGLNYIVLSQSPEELQREKDKVDVLVQEVFMNLNSIREKSQDEEILKVEKEARDILIEWKREQITLFNLVLAKKTNEAAIATKTKGANYVQQLEYVLNAIENYSTNKANVLIKQANQIESSQKSILITSTITVLAFIFGLFVLTISSILKPISMLQNTMSISANTGHIEEADIDGKNEVADMARYYNNLVKILKEEFWIKDGLNSLNQELSISVNLNEFAQKTINFLSRNMECGNAAFYLYDEASNSLHLNASFAFTERDALSHKYEIGEGTIGQAALEKKPILLKNIKRNDVLITTGTVCEAPLNTYTFPVVFEDEIYAVIELASFEPFTKLKQELIEEASKIISINLYSVIQNNKIKNLLEASEKAKKEAEKAREEVEEVNESLEQQKKLLQEQTEELQKSNVQLEEQHQLLQQQSEELQQTNAQLEEQQQQLEEQSNMLNIQNENLEKSREELSGRSKELEMANKYKSEFLANMSHELRTPLNAIILLSRLMIKDNADKLSNNNLEKIDVIHKSGHELLRLINSILDLSKIESGKMILDITKFYSEDLLFELKQLFKESANEKNIEFIAEDLADKEIIGDKNKISQILRNFLSNALKFTNEGSVTLRAELKNNSDIVFSVIDTGIGIPKEKQLLIFEEFQQLDGSTTRKYGGTGLGLCISKKLADVMDGEIKVVSNDGEGSTFSLYLKDVIVKDSEGKKYNSKSCLIYDDIELSKSEVAVDLEEGSSKTILVIEDDINFANIIKKINDDIGINTLVASNGKMGLDLAKKFKIDGILLDLGLPDISGAEVLRELKSTIELRNIPVHIISARGKDSSDLEIEDSIYHEKPISDEEITSLVLEMVNLSQENRDNLLEDITNLSLKDKNILVVDDDPRNIFVLAAALENYGATIYEAENGRDCLEQLGREKIDLVLMDIMMPEMNGFEAIRAIRTDESLKDIPIIAITAKSLKGDKEKCIEAGANDYISKPVHHDILIRLVKAWIGR
ncbi:response regulator [Clostridium cylindrosporum]|uniref:Circadian input-output histidine kinase CikA n=1 Tax=Clostridium cylindrosporum DSM 605 TaxID=1121307 RepID=A0A0J8DBQ1_CLOCY|nr:response regulator [Clostridium cylindrosporum]KMT23282.1 sensor protein GacS [Clostridium cylindrosporum DSM 605]